MFTKGVEWAYEREWRIIARGHDEIRIEQYLLRHEVPAALESFMRNQNGPGYYSIPPEAIRRVILGARVNPEIESWFRSVLSNTPRLIPIQRASIARNGLVTIEGG